MVGVNITPIVCLLVASSAGQASRGAKRITLEVVRLSNGQSGLIEVHVGPAAQVAQFGLWMLLAVHEALGQQFLVGVGRVGTDHEGAEWTAKWVVFGAE